MVTVLRMVTFHGLEGWSRSLLEGSLRAMLDERDGAARCSRSLESSFRRIVAAMPHCAKCSTTKQYADLLL